MFVTYISEWEKAFINAKGLRGKNCVLEIFDITGKVIYNNAREHSLPHGEGWGGAYFTQDVNCAAFAKGMYLVSLTTEKEKLVKKFVKE